jgi:hypothetical protein
VAVVAVFLWPAQFHYHFAGFLAPFLGLGVALPASRLMTAIAARAGRPGRPGRAGLLLRWSAAGLAAAGIAVGGWNQASFESTLEPDAPVAMMAAGQRIIPPGACVLADNVAYTITTNRFLSDVPGCPAIDDGTGANYALTGGRSALTGAGRVPAVAALWRSAFERAQYVWLTGLNHRRIAWTPALTAYFTAHFARVPNHTRGLRLYVRKDLHPR